MVSLKIVGDWAPGGLRVRELPFDLPTLVNLEGPLIPHEPSLANLAKKAGPALKNQSLPVSANDLYLSLANNHIMDFREHGLAETLRQIEGTGLRGFCGAGYSLREAKEPLIIDHESVSIGILARCERQFGVATASSAGTAPLDSSIYGEIAALKKRVNHVVLVLHGGSEMIPWPSPLRRQEWRDLIGAGASVVVGNHSHVPSSWEKYGGGVIFYGLGNFCVDPRTWDWHPQGLWSLAPEFKFSKNQFTFELKTLVVENSGDQLNVCEPSDSENRNHLAHLDELNAALADDLLLEGLWQEASIMLYKKYFASWLGFEKKNILVAVAVVLKQQISKLLSTMFRRDNSYQQNLDLLRYHLFVCDANRDVVATSLGILGGELKDSRDSRSVEMAEKMFKLK